MSSTRQSLRPSLKWSHIYGGCRDQFTRPSPIISRQPRRSITQNHIRKIRIAENEWKKRNDEIKSGKRRGMLDLLEERGYVNQIVGSRESLNELFNQRRVGAYCGVDPTAASMHVGHMVPFMALGWLYIHGYTANFLLGGFTSSIGDPTDRLTARVEQRSTARTANVVSMFEQLKRLAKSMETYAERRGYLREWAWRRAVLNNSSWWNNLTVKEFMRRLGKPMRVGPMLGRDSVKNRLEKGDGMSFAEFTYPLIQGWDWWEQFKTGTQIQIGGSDQFGNILAGAEAVKCMMKEDVDFMEKLAQDTEGTTATTDPMGFTVPLLTTSSGEKFGKSAGNAIWIDRSMLSSFDLYQFFLRSADADVERYLKLLTFLPLDEIRHIMQEHTVDESKRIAQHTLAAEFVELVHGQAAALEAEQQHRQTFSKNLTVGEVQASIDSVARAEKGGARPADLHPSLNKHAPPQDMHSNANVHLALPRSLVVQQPLSRILWSAGMVASRSEGQRLINNKGVYIGGQYRKHGETAMNDLVNYVPATDSKWQFVEQFLLNGNILILRTGKWKIKIVQIIPDAEYETSGLSCPGWKEEETKPTGFIEEDLTEEEKHRRLQHERRPS